MYNNLITVETAKLAKEKIESFYYENAYYEVLKDTYHESCHNGNVYLAYKKGQIVYSDEPPFETDCVKIGNAYTQSMLQKILRDDYKIHVSIHYVDADFGYQSVCTTMVNNTEFYESDGCKTYEDALEVGLANALKTLNIINNQI